MADAPDLESLPPPPVPPDADLKDFAFTPIYRARLFGSAFHAKVSDSEWRAGVTLWLKSQDQAPAGSLPDDDVELCRLAELGRDVKTWRRIKAGALMGWKMHADGRLYHRVVAETVAEQWQGKIDQRQRTLKGRIASLEKRMTQATDDQAKADIRAQIVRLTNDLSQTADRPMTRPVTRSATRSVTDSVTATKREREGERQGKGEGKGQGDSYSSVPSERRAAPALDLGDAPPDDPKAAIFGVWLRWLVAKSGKSEAQCRSQLGKWLKAGEPHLTAVLLAAEREKPIEPFAWIEAAMRQRSTGAGAAPSTGFNL